MDDIKKDMQKSRLRWFGQGMWMREEKIPKKMLHTKMGENNQEEGPEADGQTKYERTRKREGENGKKYTKKTGYGRIAMAGDFSVIVNQYLWK